MVDSITGNVRIMYACNLREIIIADRPKIGLEDCSGAKKIETSS